MDMRLVVEETILSAQEDRNAQIRQDIQNAAQAVREEARRQIQEHARGSDLAPTTEVIVPPLDPQVIVTGYVDDIRPFVPILAV